MATGTVTSVKVDVIESTTGNNRELEPKELVRLRIRPEGDVKGAVTVTLETTLDFYFIESLANTPDRHVQVKTISGIAPAFVYVYAPLNYDISANVTARYHDKRDSVTFFTKEFPDPEQIIEFPVKTGEIRMSQVRQFFGFGGSHPNLKEYVRGGGYVPSLKRNEHVPKSTPIRLTDLRNTVGALYFIYKPFKKEVAADTSNSSATAVLVYNMGEEAPVGYGSFAKDLDYRFIVTRTDTDRDYTITAEGGVVTTSNPLDTGWRGGNSYIKLSYRADKGEERYFRGTIRMIIRNALDHSRQIETTVEWAMFTYNFGS